MFSNARRVLSQCNTRLRLLYLLIILFYFSFLYFALFLVYLFIYSILVYFTLLTLLYFILFCCILFYFVLFHFILFYFILLHYFYFIFIFFTAFGLDCYACTSLPELSGGTKCESDKAEKITCDPLLFNRCMTAEYTMFPGLLGSRSLKLRNCSNSISCDPNSQYNCKCKNSYYLVE